MGSVTIRDTQSVGETFSEVEYTFSDASDFMAWDELKREAMSNAVKSFVGGLYTGEPLEEVSTITDIEVKKKAKETKH